MSLSEREINLLKNAGGTPDPVQRQQAVGIALRKEGAELEEGPRLTTNIVECAIEDVRIGMAVEAVYEDVDGEVTLVLFRPV